MNAFILQVRDLDGIRSLSEIIIFLLQTSLLISHIAAYCLLRLCYFKYSFDGSFIPLLFHFYLIQMAQQNSLLI